VGGGGARGGRQPEGRPRRKRRTAAGGAAAGALEERERGLRRRIGGVRWSACRGGCGGGGSIRREGMELRRRA
jgi:hypothetical protein